MSPRKTKPGGIIEYKHGEAPPIPTPKFSVWLTPLGAYCSACGQFCQMDNPRRMTETDPSKFLGPRVSCRNPNCAMFGRAGELSAIEVG